jgi:hypothetical protein
VSEKRDFPIITRAINLHNSIVLSKFAPEYEQTQSTYAKKEKWYALCRVSFTYEGQGRAQHGLRETARRREHETEH